VGTTYAASSAIDLTLGYYNVKRSWTNDVKPNASIDRIIGFAEYKFSRNTLAYLELDYNKWGGDVTQFQGGAANKSTTTGFTIGLNKKI
jgi:predicted porin